MIKTGIVGTGYWGPNLLRNLADNPDIEMRWLCDLKSSELDKLSRKYPLLKTTTYYNDLLKDTALDLIVIATPVNTHMELAFAALKAGKDVLITKPMTATTEEAKALLDIADKNRRILMVDHTFVYHPAVQYMKDAVDKKELGDLFYFQSSRMNLGLYRPDVSVICDLMAHDISILNEIVKEDPIEASVAAKKTVGLPQPDIAFLQLNYQSQLIASINASWFSPSKVREIMVTGSKKMLVYDDNKVMEKIRVYDRAVECREFLSTEESEAVYANYTQYRQGDIVSPAIAGTEALKLEVQHLVQCIQNRTQPRTNGYEGLRIVKLLESADELARSGKSWVKLSK